jgi:DNA-binding MarR family transcriptional regulator
VNSAIRAKRIQPWCIRCLVDRKLLVRVADPKDKRAALLYLSELGRDKLLSLLQRYCIAPVSAVL